MNKTNTILIFIIILLIYIMYLFIGDNHDQSCEKLIIYKKILLSKVLDKVKPGDLLLLSSNRYNIVTRTFGNDTFSHIAMIIEKNNKLYIYELVTNYVWHPGQPYYTGILITPIEERITYYNGTVYLASLINPLTNNQLLDLQNLIQNEYKFLPYWKFPFLLNTNILLGNERYCSELIAEFLDKLNISSIPVNQNKKKLQTAIVNLCDNVIYNDPIQIIPDKLLIDDINTNSKKINLC